MGILRGLLVFFIALATSVWADALSVTPRKLGPVSYYGALHTQGSKIIGEKNSNQAMLRGISLYWSDGTGLPYYKKEVISWAADKLNIDVFRFAMGIQYYDSDGGTSNPLIETNSYIGDPNGYMSLLDQMVAAAIENDVYIIIDWHSHRAHWESSSAQSFFKTVAEKYKDVPNVIYEIYNEPIRVDWRTIKSYASPIVESIRNYTDNLIIVGTSNWSQHPEEGAGDNAVPGKNIAYTFHFYAASHSKESFSGNIESALNNGAPVFISEWGTTDASGDGDPNQGASQAWMSYMDKMLLPNCNWSFRQYVSTADNKKEKSAFLDGSIILNNSKDLDEATFTASGKIVRDYLVANARSWADSITKDYRNNDCAIPHISAQETDGTIPNKLRSECTYSSSDESVVSVSGSDLIVNSYGYAILTANDGTKTVVSIKQVPSQTISGFMGVTCDYSGSCRTDRGSDRILDYDNEGKREWTFPPFTTTDQGSNYTLESLDPTIINVKKTDCLIASCTANQKAQKIWMYEFNSFGSARIVATAPAVTGFREMNDTITITYEKAKNSLGRLKNLAIALGETVENALPDTSGYGTPVTYTFDGETTSPYLQKVGTSVVAGNKKAIVTVTATIPEIEFYRETVKSVTFTIGDTAIVDTTKILSSSSANTVTPPQQQAITAIVNPQGLNASITGNMLHISSTKHASIYVDFYDMLGNRVFQQLTIDAAKTPNVGLSGLPQGSYIVRIRQQSEQITLRWVNK